MALLAMAQGSQKCEVAGEDLQEVSYRHVAVHVVPDRTVVLWFAQLYAPGQRMVHHQPRTNPSLLVNRMSCGTEQGK